MQRADGHHLAGRPLGDVALGPGVGAPQPQVAGARPQGLVAEHGGDLGEQFGGAQVGWGAEQDAVALGRDQCRQDAFVLRPGAAQHAFGLGQAVEPCVPPEGAVVDGGELRGRGVALPVQGGEARVADPADVDVPQRADGQGAHHSTGGEGLAGVQAHGAASRADVQRGDGRAEPDARSQHAAQDLGEGRRALREA